MSHPHNRQMPCIWGVNAIDGEATHPVIVDHSKLWNNNVLNSVSYDSPLIPFLFPGVKLEVYQWRVRLEVWLFLVKPTFVNFEQVANQWLQCCLQSV